jgi:hypothetical protein
MDQKTLAKAMGVSPARVSAMKSQGMPTATLEAALAWREIHVRMTMHRPPSPLGQGRAGASPGDDPLQRVSAAFEAASWALNGPQFDEAAALLRQAMRKVPAGLRHRVLLDPAVMDRLVAHVLPATQAADAALVAAGTLAPPEARPPMDDDEAHDTGAFWYAVACGELVLADA